MNTAGLRIKAGFFLFISFFKAVFLLRSPNSVELQSVSPGPPPCSGTAEKWRTVGILYINIHSFQSVLMEKYMFPTGFKYRIYSVPMGRSKIYENGQCLCFDSRLNHSVEINDM